MRDLVDVLNVVGEGGVVAGARRRVREVFDGVLTILVEFFVSSICEWASLEPNSATYLVYT